MNLRSGVLLGCIFSLLVGCSSEPKPAAAPATGAEPAPATANPTTADGSATLTAGTLTLTLTPTRPTVLEDLEALIGGVAGKVEFRWERNGALIAGQTGSRLPAGFAARGDLVTVTARSEQEEARAQVAIVNSLPRIEHVKLKELRVYRGSDLAVEVQGADPDGDALTYRYGWTVNGEDLHWEQGPVLPGDKFRRGDKVRLRVTPHDGREDGPVFAGVEMVIPNAPPKFVSEPPQQFQGHSYQYQVRADDPDGDQLTYNLEKGPKGMQIDPAGGLLSWTFGKQDSGEHRVRIVAKDPGGLGAYQEYTLALTVPQ